MKKNFVLMAFVAAASFVSSQITTTAQRPRDTNRDRESTERELELHIWNLRMISEQPRKTERKRESAHQALAQIQEDFTRLQIANRDLGRAAIKKSHWISSLFPGHYRI